MYSRTRNTLTALAAAMMFVAGGWLFGHPVAAQVQDTDTIMRSALADNGRISTALSLHRANRMTLGMPYFSFVQALPQRRAD